MTVTSILALESVSCLAMSLAVNNTLIVVAVAPARRMPWKAIANALLFGASRPTTSPTADAAAGERPREHIDALDHFAVRVLPAGLGIDEGDPVRVGVIEICEQVLVNARRRDVDVGERAREAHASN